MSALPEQAQEFFAPSCDDALDVLLAEYQAERERVESVARFMDGTEMRAAAANFIHGNHERFQRYTPNASELFSLEAAIPALNARYWQRALDMTDVLDYMPDARRKEWHEQIQKMTTPEFTEDTVRATLGTLLSQRMDFLAEMVDGIFRGLSGEHVTNRPEGFSKRLIIRWVVSDFGSIGRQGGLIHDLRCVVAKFMDRDQPHYGATAGVVERCRKDHGQWHYIDGGALKVRVYKNGNGHMEVHPDIAWRLNQVLAHLYPMAIPSRFRMKPTESKKPDVELMQRPIPFAALKLLSDARISDKTLMPGLQWREADKHVRQEAERVVEAIGGAFQSHLYVFDYDPKEVIGQIMDMGAIPDQKSHQFYPTPDRLANEAMHLAEISPDHSCLEPSAGQGGLADHMPEGTVCVEVSEIHCEVLRAKGYTAHCADFLEWSGSLFDRIVMNPPFSEGRAKAHIEHAASLLTPGGRMVAILPATFAGKDVLPGMRVSWSRVYENEFAGVSVDVVIMTAEVA